MRKLICNNQPAFLIEPRNVGCCFLGGLSSLICASQALAIIPGLSRSGITMTTGLLTGLTEKVSNFRNSLAYGLNFSLITPLLNALKSISR
jgi:hypothetical protein